MNDSTFNGNIVFIRLSNLDQLDNVLEWCKRNSVMGQPFVCCKEKENRDHVHILFVSNDTRDYLKRQFNELKSSPFKGILDGNKDFSFSAPRDTKKDLISLQNYCHKGTSHKQPEGFPEILFSRDCYETMERMHFNYWHHKGYYRTDDVQPTVVVEIEKKPPNKKRSGIFQIWQRLQNDIYIQRCMEMDTDREEEMDYEELDKLRSYLTHEIMSFYREAIMGIEQFILVKTRNGLMNLILPQYSEMRLHELSLQTRGGCL